MIFAHALVITPLTCAFTVFAFLYSAVLVAASLWRGPIR